MTAIPDPQWTPPPPQRSWGAGRILALVFGLLFLLCGLGVAAGGGALLWADSEGSRTDGYLFSDQESFTTDGFAISSERIDLSTGADWLPVSKTLGSARLDVTATGSSDVFVGIAPVADATSYLDGVERTVVADLGASAGTDGQTLVPGGAPPSPPGEQTFWTEQASGSGTQQLVWTPEEGDWMLVVMNADGSAGVSMQARIGATFPSLTGLAWGLLISGVIAVLIGVLLLVLAFRRGPERPQPTPAFPGVSPAPPIPGPPIPAPPIPAPRSPAEAPTDRTPSPPSE